jgi:hypothetical protein
MANKTNKTEKQNNAVYVLKRIEMNMKVTNKRM